jgi:hypothetical protein
VGSIFSALLAPVGIAWRLAESRIWLTIGVLAACAAASWALGRPMATLGFCFLLGIMLMRVDAVVAKPVPGA